MEVDMQLHMPYGDDPGHSNKTTSLEAARSMKQSLGALQARVLDHIRRYPSTDEEIERILGLSHQSASARRRELVLGGEIIDSGDRRKNSTGRMAIVWRVAREGETAPKEKVTLAKRVASLESKLAAMEERVSRLERVDR